MSLFGLFERRNVLDNPAIPLTSTALLDVLGEMPSDSGVRVTERTALTLSSVYRCVTLISSVCASLPLHIYKNETLEKSDSQLLQNPHPELTPYELWRSTYAFRCLWGNAYLQKIRDSVGRVQQLWPIHPERVQVGRARPIDLNPSGKIFKVTDDTGKEHALTSREILHIPHLGYDGITGVSPIRLAAQAVGLSLAAEKYAAKLFGSGNLLSGVLQTEQRLQKADAERLQERWNKTMTGLNAARKVAILDSGAKFQSLTMPNDDAEMLATREFQVQEISRYFGIPGFLLGGSQGRTPSAGAGLEQESLGWVIYDLHPTWLAPMEQRITKELVSNSMYAKYRLEGLLRGDSQARAAFYTALWGIGVLNPDEIRELEDRPPIPGGKGKGYVQPLNYAPLGTYPQPNQQPSNKTDPNNDGGQKGFKQQLDPKSQVQYPNNGRVGARH
jgi:HK97 family phage portal protein